VTLSRLLPAADSGRIPSPLGWLVEGTYSERALFLQRVCASSQRVATGPVSDSWRIFSEDYPHPQIRRYPGGVIRCGTSGMGIQAASVMPKATRYSRGCGTSTRSTVARCSCTLAETAWHIDKPEGQRKETAMEDDWKTGAVPSLHSRRARSPRPRLLNDPGKHQRGR